MTFHERFDRSHSVTVVGSLVVSLIRMDLVRPREVRLVRPGDLFLT